MQAATAMSVGLLVLGLVLACCVHPEPHAAASAGRRANAASK
jgi:DHA2 family methylenomycin A resistance protein-like MFS transporter